MTSMPFEDLEQVYEALAEAVDHAGERREALFLMRFALTLAHRTGDLQAVRDSIAIALKDLPD